ncbi:MAG: flagellar assembly protein FliW [Deltaproteobacteria bacterium]|nr:flagellar assembly protein FliW [Deltaproteobacteria bacterium]
MEILTTRFGQITVDDGKVIEMRGGILGFDRLRRYVFLIQNRKVPFWILQSAEEPSVAFYVINPFLVKPDYAPTIRDEDVALLEIESPQDVTVMVIATIRTDPMRVAVNLRAPVIINVSKMLAKQIVLEDQSWQIQCSLVGETVADESDDGDDRRKSLVSDITVRKEGSGK